ncbi:MAG: VOC family protein [Clostridiales bacterium]
MVTGIEHIAIMSKDTEKLKNWYQEMFGFKIVYDNGKGTFFLMVEDGSMIEFVKSDETVEKESAKLCGIRHLAFSVDNFEEMVEKLKKNSVEIITEASVSSSGIKTFFFRDIDDNVIHLIYRPKALG